MKVLSIKQPWAELIIDGVKDVENRTWDTNYRGPILIHAPKSFDHSSYQDLLRRYPNLPPCVQGFTRGAIIGAARLVESTMIVGSRWHEMGLFGFYLEDVIRLDKPVPCRGRLGLFNLDSTELSPRRKCDLIDWVNKHIPALETEKHHGR